MKTAHTVRLPQPSVAVTFAQTKGENPVAEARAILDDELAGLGTMGVGLEVHGIEELDVPLGRGVLSTHRLSLEGVRLLQMQLVVVTGQMAVRAVASTGEPDKVAELKAVLASLSMEKQ